MNGTRAQPAVKKDKEWGRQHEPGDDGGRGGKTRNNIAIKCAGARALGAAKPPPTIRADGNGSGAVF